LRRQFTHRKVAVKAVKSAGTWRPTRWIAALEWGKNALCGNAKETKIRQHRMEQFVWDSYFETGLADVDFRHHGLVDLINRFGNLLLRPQNVEAGEVTQVLRDLADYALLHFTEEEQMMVSAGVDPRFVQAHVVKHADFLREVQRQSVALPGASAGAARDLHEFLVSWLAFHILGVDQLMARQMAAIREGETPGEAFRSVVRVQDAATATLVRSMERLFQQVSNQNRELFELNQSLEARVAKRTEDLSEANRRLDDLASTDPLTGLANRRAAMRLLQIEWPAVDSSDQPLSCIMIDADGFKEVNDAYGHDAGDAVLRQLARCLSQSVRSDDAVCRLGGDEFLVICSRTPLPGALKTAESIRQNVCGLRVPVGSSTWQGSVSCGVAVRDAGMADPGDLLRAADQGLYAAKRGGRNRVGTVSSAT
jgi:hemerythrin